MRDAASPGSSLLAVPETPRPAADQRRLLAETIRRTAGWRRRKSDEYRDADDHRRGRENARVASALRTLANFVDELPDDDPDLDLHALRRTEERNGQLALTDDAAVLLSRFGLNPGAWQAAKPPEIQMRNVLRKLDGVEARERAGRKRRAEQGYGDD
jgi:hypothetical protein